MHPVKEIGNIAVQCVRDFYECPYGDVSLTSFYGSYVGSVKSALLSKPFLRKTVGVTTFFDFACQMVEEAFYLIHADIWHI